MKSKFLFFFFLVSLHVLGQKSHENYKVSGKIIDAVSQVPLQFITATLQDPHTQEIIGDITDKNGIYQINAPKKEYDFIITSLSFKKYVIRNIRIEKDTIINTIELSQKIEKLEEVEIMAETQILDYKSGKKIYHAAKDIANIGGNAITVLENTPSVRVDGEGNISIRGNKATVYVDGKPYGGIKSNADILSLIPANAISKVEIINQSAQFDAKSGGGALNIILKKRTNEGYNGTVEGHLGTPDNDGASAFINYKTDKINIFSTTSLNHGVINKNTKINQIFLDQNQNPNGYFDENRDDYRQRNSVLFNIGSDFYIDKKNTLTTSLLFSSTNKNYDSNLFLEDYLPKDNLINSSFRDVDDNSDESYLEAFFNYNTKFNKKGHELSANINFDKNTSNNKTSIFNHKTYPVIETSNQQYLKDEYVDDLILGLDYTLPIKENNKLDIGIKSSFRSYENDFTISEYNSSINKFESIDAYTNLIRYDEKIYAFYANYSKKINVFDFSLGLRNETTRTTITEVNSTSEFINNYTDLFPTFSINYQSENENSLLLYFIRYIDRPTISQLNPFNSFTDERFIVRGSPFLNPSYTNYITFEYHTKLKKHNLNTAIFYTNTTDYILDVMEKTFLETSDGFDIYQRLPTNNGTLNQTGLECTFTYIPSNKLRAYITLTPFYAQLKDTYQNEYDYNDFRYYGQFSIGYRFNNTLRAKLDYQYQSPIKTALTEIGRYQFANLTTSKDFFNNKATLSFKIQDIFNSRKGVYKSLEANTISERRTSFQTRFLISFLYRFNKSSKRNTHNRSKDIDRDVFEIKDKTE